MAVADFYNAFHNTRGIPYQPFEELTSAEQQPFMDAYADAIVTPIETNEAVRIRHATLVISNAQMKTLRAVPRTIVPAVPNNVIIPIMVFADTPVSTTARTGARDVRLRWRRSSTTFTNITGDIDRTTMQGSTTASRSAIEYPVSAVFTHTLTSLRNKSIILHNVDSAEYGAGSGNNVVTFRVAYFLLEI